MYDWYIELPTFRHSYLRSADPITIYVLFVNNCYKEQANCEAFEKELVN